MMGTKASKPVAHQPPADLDQQEVRRPFEAISPCSDLSNPSDFNRVKYHRQTQLYQIQPPSPQQRRGENRDGNAQLQRRVSNNSSTNDHSDLPVAVKVRRSNSTAGNNSGRDPQSNNSARNGGEMILAPGSFYFPTKESERRAERLAKKELRSEHQEIVNTFATIQEEENMKSKMIGMNMSIGIKQRTKSIRRGARKAAKKMKKQKDTIKRIALAVATACLEDTKNAREEEEKAEDLRAERQLIVAQESETYPSETKISASVSRTRRRSEIIAPGDLKATTSGRDAPHSKVAKDCNMKVDNYVKSQERYQSEMERVASIALHQEDIYFARLSLSPSAQHGASPFVQNGSNNRVTSILNSKKTDPDLRTNVESTPTDRKRMSVDSPMDTPVSDLFSASGSLVEKSDNNYLIESIKNNNNNSSPVSSLMRFYTKTGPMKTSQKSYCSDEDEAEVQFFTDEQSEASSQITGNGGMPEKDIMRRQSQESHSSLYTVESKTYNFVDGKDLKLLVHDDGVVRDKETDALSSYIRSTDKGEEPKRSRNKKTKQGKPKVSKLESLFRPILPALSTDDAQSISSYDPYEIKVTESAPGIIQAANYMSLGVRRSSPSSGSTVQSKKKTSLSSSKSVISIDTQRESYPTTAKHMVSSQADINSEFLFTDDYGPVVVAQNPDKPRNFATFSISTAEARSRLPHKSTQKGVDISMRTRENELDNISVDNNSLKSERRVRFLKDSIHLLPDEDQELSKVEGIECMVDVTGQPTTALPHYGTEGNDLGERVNSDEDIMIYPEDEELEVKSNKELPCSRFQDTRHNVGAQIGRVDSVAESIDLPEVERKMANRRSLESVRSFRSNYSIPESILEEDEEERTVASSGSVHWTYSKNGVTPFAPGRSAANPAKSPLFRYRDAKTKFNTQNLILPEKSPKKSPAKVLRRGSGGLVSIRIHELNNRVTEVRKLKRMRKKMTNPRLHTHNFDNTQPVRNRALINYKTDIASANLEKSNYLMAAKFNMIPDDDDDDESTFSAGTIQNTIIASERGAEDDDASRMSEMTSVASVATVRQHRDSCGHSMSSRTTASSGLSNLKKQVFRASNGTKRLASISDSTTISSIIDKENENYLPFRSTCKVVKPNEQHFGATPAVLHLTPSKGTPAMKWRSLAAAAAEKDALKASTSKAKKVLSIRNMNHDLYHR